MALVERNIRMAPLANRSLQAGHGMRWLSGIFFLAIGGLLAVAEWRSGAEWSVRLLLGLVFVIYGLVLLGAAWRLSSRSAGL